MTTSSLSENQPEQRLWVARNDANYCVAQFESFLIKLEDELDWSCETQGVTVAQSGSGKEEILALEQEKSRALEQERILALEQERILALEQERILALEQEKILALEQEKSRALEQERILALEQERSRALEQERVLALEQERIRALEEESILASEEQEAQELAVSAADEVQKKSAVCLRDEITRIVELRVEGPTGVPCSVDYIKPDENQPDQRLWVARNDANYCVAQFESFVMKLEDELDWSCETQGVTVPQSGSGKEKILALEQERSRALEQERSRALEHPREKPCARAREKPCARARENPSTRAREKPCA